jgi:antitoxin component of RelBE/YafQ-DinJ toxin-antitoxin module
MDAIVAARVPVEIKEQGNNVLASIGATPTELINTAYRYVLRYGRLPLEETEAPSGARVLLAERHERLDGQLRRLRVSDYDYSAGDTRTFKQALEEKRKAEYRATSA